MIFGPYTPLIIVIFALSMLIQWYLKRTYRKWSQVGNLHGLTGAEVARKMLDEHGLHSVTVEMVPGQLSDHYDPRQKAIRLSEGNFSQPSVAAMAVAAHEVGHAIQDKVRMPALVLRGQMAMPLSLGMNIAPFMVMGGLALGFMGLFWVGVILFAFAMLFHLVTLPVEFDASRRALDYIDKHGMGGETLSGSKSVLTAAALTYVVGFAMALAQLLNLLAMSRR